ncbi:hypothetical protein [Spirillospora sp. CA-294931]|uniref:hypothetical protein n=1 Tax=Spirillospora sp. CA-294931 TaxID=3240042 RepID=UPI003D93CA25
MEHELVGLHGPGDRLRPVSAGPFSLMAVALALAPIRPVWLWATLIASVAALPWVLAVVPGRHRARPYWRLSSDGLEHVGAAGGSLVRYERSRIEALAITTDDGVLTVFHKFGRTAVGSLPSMGLEPLTVFVTARRLGIPVQLLDGDSAELAGQDLGDLLPGLDADPEAGASTWRDHAAEQNLLDLEAELLAAAHEPPRAVKAPRAPEVTPAPSGGPGEPAPSAEAARAVTAELEGAAAVPAAATELATPAPRPSRLRVAILGVMCGAVGAVMVARIAVAGTDGFETRLAAGCWALAAIGGVLAARRRMARATRVKWTITPEAIRVSGRPFPREPRVLPGTGLAALVVGPGLRLDPITREPRSADLSVLAFDHRLRLVARLPSHGLDAFQLAHALDDHGYRVVTPGARPPRRPDYGLDGLPEIFAQVPGGRLVVAEGGLGWADATGDVVLRMPEDRLGAIELLTIAGHAWVRLYDSDGDEFFSAPLSAMRISRTDLREAARREGLPITDAEYDAYLSAAFHSAVSALSAPSPGAADGLATAAGSAAPSVTLDATRRSRLGTYGMSMVLCELVALLGAVWLGPDLGGFAVTASWAVPAGLVIGLGGYWGYDRNRDQLRVSSAGLAVVTRRGKVEWDLERGRVGGVGLDDSGDGTPKLVVWSPECRVLHEVPFPPDMDELRRACERHGLPWGPPDADHPAPPPPEL